MANWSNFTEHVQRATVGGLFKRAETGARLAREWARDNGPFADRSIEHRRKNVHRHLVNYDAAEAALALLRWGYSDDARVPQWAAEARAWLDAFELGE